MQFTLIGVKSDSEMTKDFNKSWKEATEKENGYLAQKPMRLSSIQEFTIDIYTGQVCPDQDVSDNILCANLPAQMELEAVFRGRSIALAQALQNNA